MFHADNDTATFSVLAAHVYRVSAFVKETSLFSQGTAVAFVCINLIDSIPMWE